MPYAGRCGRRGEDVCRREDPRLPRLGLTRQRAVVPRAVDPLVVRRRRLDERRQRAAAHEDALGGVRVQPDLLPLRGRQRAGLVPDPVRDAHPAEVVHEGRPAEPATRRAVEPGVPACRLRERRDRPRVAADPGRLEIGEVSERDQ